MHIKSTSLKQFMRFVIVGGAATLIHYLIYLFLGLHIGNNIAYTIGYGISFIFNFIVSNYFTFNTTPTKSGGFKFLCAHGFNYLLQMGLLNLYINLGVGREIAPFFVYAICVPVNFILVKRALKEK